MRRTFYLISALLSFGTPVAADGPVVLELYTSQGCSSCPPADAILHSLAERSDLIPLAMHVDYWDYIGWVDSFADPAHTLRQQYYAHVAGDSTIYTPQMVIAGEDHVIGAQSREIAAAIQKHQGTSTGVSVDLRRDGDTLQIIGNTSHPLPNGTVVQLVRYNPSETVDVRRGENAGRQLTYANIVTDWDVVGEWSGANGLRMDVTVTGEAPIVVIVQEPGPGAVMASAVLR